MSSTSTKRENKAYYVFFNALEGTEEDSLDGLAKALRDQAEFFERLKKEGWEIESWDSDIHGSSVEVAFKGNDDKKEV